MPGVLRAKVAGVWQEVGGPGGGATTGRIKATVSAVVPSGWLAFGQTVVGAQTLYPDLWALAPAWQSGADLVLPDATDCALLGGALGPVGGSNSLTLVAANLPIHLHTMAHTHSNAHDHATFNTAITSSTSAAAHVHAVIDGTDNVVGTHPESLARGDVIRWVGSAYMISGGEHYHGTTTFVCNPPSFSGTSGSAAAANSGSAGTGTALDTTPKALRVTWIIKT